ncbi:N-acetylmuramoyl-L-alanine amidase [Flavobacterium sp. MAH-1]|uniref:N-acetylmuramoyl-L-alanine amidase n=1 Tax=Flavobacterium agri TaxID=2743471 RepID=A0A7Y8Y3P0_9FLAO|nr:N-acetylmuramoyl-L-alanine amidase [Flavobacterium agri]NUY81990.1 N-acetylmuramoyl-L-alanine amidase [Flavobacterium agri]NYA72014.1 N-acetylmuramoyl-L-alanine amidase [Flavobacterium agri]
MKKSLNILLAAAVVSALAFIGKPSPKTAKHEEPKKIHVVIDAGHGGNDFGASFENVTEKDVVAQITNKIKQLNKNENVEIILTRASDEPVTLQQRTEVINASKPDVVISLHVTASKDSERSGVGLYIAKENASKQRAMELATKMSARIKKNHAFHVSEINEAPFYVLKNSQAPAIIVELGYLTNEGDRHYLTDEKQQLRIARTILECVNDLR